MFSNSKSKIFSKNMKLTGNSYVLSTSKDDNHMARSNKSSSSKLKTIHIVSNQNIQNVKSSQQKGMT